MLLVASALKNNTIEATDGRIGTVSDFLFDDRSWKIRWMVANAGTWLAGRKVLVHPSAIGRITYDLSELPVALTKAQVEGSPDIASDLPVSRQMEASLGGYYGWDTNWGGGGYIGSYSSAIGLPFVSPPVAAVPSVAAYEHAQDAGADPHLRSMTAVTGDRITANDGEIGHVGDMLIDDQTWDVRYLIVDTRNWWPGKHVLISPSAVREITWPDNHIEVSLTRDQVKSSPPWDPIGSVDETYEKQLRRHYDWPGYGLY